LNALRLRKRWVKRISSARTRIIVSYHNFLETPPNEFLEKVYEEASNYGKVVKIVTAARNLDDNFRVLALYQKVKTGKLLAFCMGNLGVVSRILCPLMGSPFTYASLRRGQTAPGQIERLGFRKGCGLGN
jgi:3-dehydroquinate dehydratase-1